MQRSVTQASLVVLLLLGSSLVTSCLAHLRVGAFNVRVFGQTKVANADVLNILVQVISVLLKCIIFNFNFQP